MATDTYYIYHIVGRKVGCCKDIEQRMRHYINNDGERPVYEILEILRGKTKQEAGDIEWAWADRFGYWRGGHYATLNGFNSGAAGKAGGQRATELGVGLAGMTHEQHVAAGKAGARRRIEIQTPKQRSEAARKAGLVGGVRSSEVLTSEQRIERSRKAGRRSAEVFTTEQRSEKSRENSGCVQQIVCPHCGKLGNTANMKRWHFDFCLSNPNRKIRPVIVTECPHCGFEGTSLAVMKQWHFDNCRYKPKPRFVRRA